jgi:hypothetical protein
VGSNPIARSNFPVSGYDKRLDASPAFVVFGVLLCRRRETPLRLVGYRLHGSERPVALLKQIERATGRSPRNRIFHGSGFRRYRYCRSGCRASTRAKRRPPSRPPRPALRRGRVCGGDGVKITGGLGRGISFLFSPPCRFAHSAQGLRASSRATGASGPAGRPEVRRGRVCDGDGGSMGEDLQAGISFGAREEHPHLTSPLNRGRDRSVTGPTSRSFRRRRWPPVSTRFWSPVP